MDNCKYYDVPEFNALKFKNHFSVISQNIRSMRNFDHFKQLMFELKTHNFSIVGLQEIRKIPQSVLYKLKGYSNLEYRTRAMGNGGGVGIFVNSKHQYEVLNDVSIFQEGVIESLLIKVTISPNYQVIVGNFYKAPSVDTKIFNQQLLNIMNSLNSNQQHKKLEKILFGDFNIDLLNHDNHTDTAEYLTNLTSSGYLPHITLPTRVEQRINGTESATIIDHINSNSKKSFTSGILKTDISDHFTPFLVLNIPNKGEKPKTDFIEKHDFSEQNIDNMVNLLETVDFTAAKRELDIKKAYSGLVDPINNCMDEKIPLVRKKVLIDKLEANPWMNDEILAAKKIKEKLFKKKSKHPTPNNILAYKQYRNYYSTLYRNIRDNYYHRKFRDSIGNMKETWCTIKEILRTQKVHDKIPHTFYEEGKKFDNPKDIAEGFNNFFTDIGPNLANKIPNGTHNFKDYLNRNISSTFQFHEVTLPELHKIVQSIKPKPSSGHDRLSSKLIKRIYPIICGTLLHVINLSLCTGFIPDDLKIAKIIPVYKKGPNDSFTNYRPISLLPSISKILEKVVAQQVMEYLDENNLLYKHQYGFRKSYNSSHPILQFINRIYESYAKGEITIGIFLDLKKAFDTVNHKILLEKLKYYGFDRAALKWFESYLSNRKQYVEINGTKSSFRTMSCGVPQGSVLGPLLFLLYINDLPNIVDFFSLLFADDTTFLTSNKDINVLFRKTQSSIKTAAEWFQANKLTLHPDKTKYMVFIPPKTKCDNLNNLSLTLNSTQLQRVGTDCPEKTVKFLGVWFDDKLSWKNHILEIQKKLNCSNYYLAQIRNSVPTKVKLTIYNSLFKSHIEYGILAWGKVTDNIIKPLITMQKRAVRNVVSAPYLAHTDGIFRELGLLKLKDIYKLQAGVFVKKFYDKQLPSSYNNFFTRYNDVYGRQITDRNNLRLDYRTHDTNRVNRFPQIAIPKCWNSIPFEIRKIEKLTEFKNLLKISLTP